MKIRTIGIAGVAIAVVASGIYAAGIIGRVSDSATSKPVADSSTSKPVADSATSKPVADSSIKGPTTGATAAGAPMVSVVVVEPVDFVESLTLTGTLVPREEVLIATEIEGLRIVEVTADESQLVKKGDVLARLETASLDAQLAQNEASLARGAAAIAQAQSAIASAEAKVVEAGNALTRARPLRQSGILAEATFDQRESAAKAADAALLSARDGLKLANADKALVEAQRRDLAWKRSKTEIRAPVDGLISRRNAKVGALAAGAGDPMFRMIANSEIELDADVPEVQLGRLTVGQPATLTIAGLPDVSGRVRLVSPEIDRTSRLGRVRILADGMANPRVGSFARASVVVGQGRGLAVPAAAVQFQADGPTVQRVDNDRVTTRRIVTGLQARGLVEIKSGVDAGDMVVARAGTFVRDGDVIRPVPVPAVSTPTAKPKVSEVN